MKILQFIYSLEPGGAERFVVDLSNELAQNNNVKLFSFLDDRDKDYNFYVPELDPRVAYCNLRLKKGFNPFLFFRFIKILKREKPDVVHCHLNLIFYFIPCSLLFKKIKFFYTVHNTSDSEVRNKMEKMMMRFVFKNKHFVPVTISEETRRSYMDFYKLDSPSLIYNGRSRLVATGLFGEVKAKISSLKKSDQTTIFAHIARSHPSKNQKMLISVFKRLFNEGVDFVLLMIGQDFEKDYNVKELELYNIFFMGTIPNVQDYLLLSDAFCLSSLYEGMPISLIEAFGCGCVPVCTPVGGCKDVIKNGITGFLSESINEVHYYDAVNQYICNKDRIQRKSLQDYYSNNFSIETCAMKYMDLFEKQVI